MTVFPFLSAAVGGYILMAVIGIQVLIALFSSIPLAKRRHQLCPVFNFAKAKRRIIFIMVSGSILMVGITVLMLWLAPAPSSTGYLFGLILSLLCSIRRMSPSDRRNQTSFTRMFADCYFSDDEDATQILDSNAHENQK